MDGCIVVSSAHATCLALIAVLSLGCAQDDPAEPSADDETGATPATGTSSDGGPAAESGDSPAGTTGADGSSDGAESGGVTIPDPVPDDCITEVTAGHHVFACDGFDFDVEVPEGCIGTQCGLIVDVHGYTMDAAMEDKNTEMRRLGAERGYVVVQPNANPEPPNASWNVSDDEIVFDFAMRTVAAFHLDENRLNFTGFSQGGFMSWRFACKYGDVFTAIAPGAACSASGVVEGCSFDGDVAGTPHLMYIHGLTDSLVPYDGCAEPQRDQVLAAYAMDESAEVVAAEAEYRWNRWTSPDGVVFEMIDHDYRATSPILGGHCYPGSEDLEADLPGQFLAFGCNPVSPIHYGEAIVDFFDAHPKL
ncbi:MAG: hypothetical protein AAF721_31890 [Myxococcota bacterium]